MSTWRWRFRARRRASAVAVLYVDIDDLKLTNDSLGHRVGDELLQETANRLRSAVRKEDLVGRQGGDEFLVMVPDLELGPPGGEIPAGAAETATCLAVTIAERICTAMRLPIETSAGLVVSSRASGSACSRSTPRIPRHSCIMLTQPCTGASRKPTAPLASTPSRLSRRARARSRRPEALAGGGICRDLADRGTLVGQGSLEGGKAHAVAGRASPGDPTAKAAGPGRRAFSVSPRCRR